MANHEAMTAEEAYDREIEELEKRAAFYKAHRADSSFLQVTEMIQMLRERRRGTRNE